VLAFTRPADLDLISPPTQALARGAQGTFLAPFIAPGVALLLIAAGAAGGSNYFNAVVRLPMVAGWDRLLPVWVSRLHPRFRTPVGSILAVFLATIALTVFGNFGVGSQEAFQFLNNEGNMCWGLTYLVMFSIPLLARGEKPALGVRIAAVSGFMMTLLYVVLSMFPIVDVRNRASFTIKVVAVILVINGTGALYFRHAARKRRLVLMQSEVPEILGL